MKHLSLLARFVGSVLCLSLNMLPAQIHAQTADPAYPAKPIRLVVPFTPGSAPDTLARLVGGQVATSLGSSAFVDNRAGASGVIGTAAAAKAAPDGYTLLVSPSTHVINAAIRKTAYDPIADFVPVAQLTSGSFLIVCSPTSPAKSLAELVALLKAGNGQSSYSSPGIASTVHLFTEMFLQTTGTKARHIPSKGISGALMDVLQASVDFTISPIELALPQIRAGKVRALAQTNGTRLKAAPDVPTVKELGYTDFEATYWVGIYAPAGTPPAIVAKLNRAINEQLAKPDVIQALDLQGLEPIGGTPAQFAARNKADLARFSAVVKQSNMVFE